MKQEGRVRHFCLHARRPILALFATAWLGEATLAGCRADGASAVQGETWVATLVGTREVPAVVTTATGSAIFTLSGRTVSYTITASGFSTPLTVGHVHLGGAGIVSVVIVPFAIAAQSGTVASGTIDLSVPVTFGNVTIPGDSLRTLFAAGQAYVNLHSAAYPGGEIRGQIVRK